MAEYIERAAVYEKLNNLPHEYRNAEQRARTGGIAACKEIVRYFPAADVVERPRWISVKERMPKDERQVLAYYGFDHGDGYLGMMFVQVLDWFGHDPKPHFQHEGLNGMKVTHWMPLPEPPKEE